MWCPAQYLPLLIGEHIPLEFPHWECFLQLLLITDYVFVPIMSHNDIAYIKDLIKAHHQQFRSLYFNASFIPKLHYIIHVPEWISRLIIIGSNNYNSLIGVALFQDCGVCGLKQNTHFLKTLATE